MVTQTDINIVDLVRQELVRQETGEELSLEKFNEILIELQASLAGLVFRLDRLEDELGIITNYGGTVDD